MVKRNWSGGRGCSRSDDNVCSSVTETSDNKEFSSEHLRFLSKKDPNCVIIGHININSIRNKFYYLIAITKGCVDVLMISETKLESHSLPCNSTLTDTVFLGQIEMLKEVVCAGRYSM